MPGTLGRLARLAKMRHLPFFFALGLLAGILPASEPVQRASAVVRVHVFQAACSQAQRSAVEKAIAQADELLRQSCALTLTLTAWTQLPLQDWCHLPTGQAESRAALKQLAARAKADAPAELAFFLLPSSADERLSWALVDVSRHSACDSPQESRYLKDFGTAFFTDLAFLAAEADLARLPSEPALLVAHEAIHALSNRGHPTHAGRGELMADHLADIGPRIPQDWCACARRSPYAARSAFPRKAP